MKVIGIAMSAAAVVFAASAEAERGVMGPGWVSGNGWVFDSTTFGNGLETTIPTSQFVETLEPLGIAPFAYRPDGDDADSDSEIVVYPINPPVNEGQFANFGAVYIQNEGQPNAILGSIYFFPSPGAPPEWHELGMRITFDSPVYTFASWINVESAEARVVSIYDTSNVKIAEYDLQTVEFGYGTQFFGYESTIAIGAVKVAEPDFDGVGVPKLFKEILFSRTTVAGDLDGDGNTNGADLAILLATWGACDLCDADLNGDGTIDGADLAVLLANWTP